MKCGSKKYSKGGKVSGKTLKMAEGGLVPMSSPPPAMMQGMPAGAPPPATQSAAQQAVASMPPAAAAPSGPANFNPQGRGAERARFMRGDSSPGRPDFSRRSETPIRPAMPTAVAGRPFKKGGMVKKASGGSVKPRGASGRGVKACKVC